LRGSNAIELLDRAGAGDIITTLFHGVGLPDISSNPNDLSHSAPRRPTIWRILALVLAKVLGVLVGLFGVFALTLSMHGISEMLAHAGNWERRGGASWNDAETILIVCGIIGVLSLCLSYSWAFSRQWVLFFVFIFCAWFLSEVVI